MSKLVVSAWIVAAICAVAAVVDLAVRPMHWERTIAVAVVVGVIAAVVAVVRSRRPSQA